MRKQDARRYYLEQRKQLGYDESHALSEAICDRIFAEFRFAGKHVHVFLPIRKNKEVDLSLLVEKIWQSGGNTLLSVSDFDTSTMRHYRYTSETELKENSYGIPEPVGSDEVMPQDIDLVLLPMVAFDRDGHRVGYGKGFYDRFLKSLRPDCVRVGVSYFDPVSRFADVEPHDAPLHLCVTPDAVHRMRAVQPVIASTL
jgi:5-formyltetrahydrofolate cyclo-ligase